MGGISTGSVDYLRSLMEEIYFTFQREDHPLWVVSYCTALQGKAQAGRMHSTAHLPNCSTLVMFYSRKGRFGVGEKNKRRSCTHWVVLCKKRSCKVELMKQREQTCPHVRGMISGFCIFHSQQFIIATCLAQT